MIEVKPDVGIKEKLKNCPANGESGSSSQNVSIPTFPNRKTQKSKLRAISGKKSSRKGNNKPKSSIASKKNMIVKKERKCPLCEFVTPYSYNLNMHCKT